MIFPCASRSRTKQGVPSSELQSFFHCPALLSFHLLIQVLLPSRHKKNRPNPDSESSGAPRVVGPVVLHACVYPACFVEGSPSCLPVNSRCSITEKGRQRLFFFFFSFPVACVCTCVYAFRMCVSPHMCGSACPCVIKCLLLPSSGIIGKTLCSLVFCVGDGGSEL